MTFGNVFGSSVGIPRDLWIKVFVVAAIAGLTACSNTRYQRHQEVKVDSQAAANMPADVAVAYLRTQQDYVIRWRACKFDHQGAELFRTFDYRPYDDEVKAAQQDPRRIGYKSLYAKSLIWLDEFFLLILVDRTDGKLGVVRQCEALYTYLSNGKPTVGSLYTAGRMMTALKSLGVTERK